VSEDGQSPPSRRKAGRADAYARRYFAWRFWHPWLSWVIELPIALLGVLLLWLLLGRTAALIYAAVLLVLELLSLPSKVVRHRAAPRRDKGGASARGATIDP
jgi:hypothetical protein